MQVWCMFSSVFLELFSRLKSRPLQVGLSFLLLFFLHLHLQTFRPERSGSSVHSSNHTHGSWWHREGSGFGPEGSHVRNLNHFHKSDVFLFFQDEREGFCFVVFIYMLSELTEEKQRARGDGAVISQQSREQCCPVLQQQADSEVSSGENPTNRRAVPDDFRSAKICGGASDVLSPLIPV